MSPVQNQEKSPPIARRRYGKWMYGLFVVPPIAAVLTVMLAPDPHGHWSEHLLGAYLDGAQLALLVVLTGMLAARDWRSMGSGVSVLLLLTLGMIATGIVYEVVGNYQVAESIWQTTGNPGFGDGYNQGHDRAATGDLWVVIGGAAFAFSSGFARRVPLKVAGLGLIMVVVPPPFLWPAAGVLMLLLYGLTSANGLNRNAERAPDPAGTITQPSKTP